VNIVQTTKHFLPEGLKRGWPLAYVLALTLFIGIVGYLLWYGYRTQSRLQTAAMVRLEENIAARARTLDYFIQERRNDVRELAVGSLVSAYFTNKALGMSEQYGLKGSLIHIAHQLRYLNEAVLFAGQGVYSYLALFSPSGEKLAEHHGVQPCPIVHYDWRAIEETATKDSGAVVDSANPAYLVIAAPVRQAGRIVGYIAGWVWMGLIDKALLDAGLESFQPTDQISHTMIIDTGKAGWYARSIDEKVLAELRERIDKAQSDLPAAAPTGLAGIGHTCARFTVRDVQGRGAKLLALVFPLRNEPIRMIQVLDLADLTDPGSPLRLLLLLAVISATVIGVAFVALRHGTKAQVLAAMLAESDRRQEQIRLVNEKLQQEILQRKMAESQITSEKNRLRRLISAIPDLVWFKDIHLAFIGCNHAFEALCGLTEPTLINRQNGSFGNLGVQAVFDNKDQEVLETGRPVQFEQWVTYPDGRQALLDTKKTPYYSQSGEMIGLIAIGRDITARKQVELALKEQQERLELVIGATNIGVWEWDIPSGATIFNERWAEIVGYRLEELEPVSIWTWMAICHPDDLRRSNLAIERHFEGKDAFYDCECRMRHKNGSWVWVNDRGRVVEWTTDNKPLRMIGTHVDTTFRKTAEENLREANESLEQRVRERTRQIEQLHSQLVMQEKLASVGQLAAGLAHELNNPINFVLTNFATLTENFADLTDVLNDYHLLVDDVDGRPIDPAKIAAIRAKEEGLQIDFLLHDIPALFSESERGFQRIDRVIQSMRNFSYKDHNGNRTYFNINKGIEDTLIIAKNVYKYHADVQADLADVPEVLCLPEQIHQVLLNLVVNSAQAIAENPSGAKGVIAIQTWRQNDHVCCRIADNGPGIPEQIRSRIFEPFFTTKAPGKGTGLGLSISYDIIVNKHGGEIAVACPEIGGTAFTFKIPLGRKPTETQNANSQ